MKKKFLLISCMIAILCRGFSMELPAVFSDHMVLQRNTQVAVWGTSDYGEHISVEGSWGDRATTWASKTGHWLVRIQTPDAGGPYTLKINGEHREVILEDILIGEVWLCSGQSNMGWPVHKSQNPESEIRNANYPNIRFFDVKNQFTLKPWNNCHGSWQVCTPQSTEYFSAAAYFFGREINRELDIPVGLIHSSWGGTPVESWTNDRFLKQVTDYEPIDPMTKIGPRSPAVLYNGMIHPLIPYTLNGCIWYQGESNVNEENHDQYRELFSAMISNWRSDWDLGNFPFYFVQIAPFKYHEDKQSEVLREAQLKTLAVPNTGMAVTMDIGNPRDIHPKNKQEVGRRLARWALAKDYDRDLVYSGPLYKSIQVKGNKIYVYFRHTGSGLMTKDDQLKHFEVAGSDGIFVPAEGRIKNNHVVVRSPEVSNPKYVRYAWGNAIEASLFNKEGLPASPFNSQNWQTTGNRENGD